MKYIYVMIANCLLLTINAPAQIITDSLLIENHYRSFHYMLPQTKLQRPSLVFNMHGSGSNGLQIMQQSKQIEKIAHAENMLMVYPNGYKNFWNECRKASTALANTENINEEAFFTAMIQYFKEKFQVDTQNVFAVGFSGGGHMAYKLALTMPKTIKAITAIVANLPDTSNMDCSEAKIPIPVMIINGTADGVNPYNGGQVNVQGFSVGKVRSTEATFHYWATLAGYNQQPTEKNLPDIDSTDGKHIVQYTYSSKNKPEVTLLKVVNGGHNYPGDIDVYVAAWNFFKRNRNYTLPKSQSKKKFFEP